MKRAGRILVLLLVGVAVGWLVHHRSHPRADRPAQAALSRVIPVIRFRDLPLEDVLHDFEHATGVPIDVNWDALLDDGIVSTSPATLHRYDCTLRDALVMLLRVRPDQVYTDAEARRIEVAGGSNKPLVVYVKRYDVAEVIGPDKRDPASKPNSVQRVSGGCFAIHNEADGRDALAAYIRDTVDRSSWIDNGGSLGSISFAGNSLIVVQSGPNHDAIADLLRQMGRDFAVAADTPVQNATKVELKHLLARRFAGTLIVDGQLADDALDSIRAAFRANVTFDERAWLNWENRLTARVSLKQSSPTLEQTLRAWAAQVGIAPGDISLVPEKDGIFGAGVLITRRPADG